MAAARRSSLAYERKISVMRLGILKRREMREHLAHCVVLCPNDTQAPFNMLTMLKRRANSFIRHTSSTALSPVTVFFQDIDSGLSKALPSRIVPNFDVSLELPQCRSDRPFV
jgi:hypothetical protein